jgi:hypothetical protein
MPVGRIELSDPRNRKVGNGFKRLFAADLSKNSGLPFRQLFEDNKTILRK